MEGYEVGKHVDVGRPLQQLGKLGGQDPRQLVLLSSQLTEKCRNIEQPWRLYSSILKPM